MSRLTTAALGIALGLAWAYRREAKRVSFLDDHVSDVAPAIILHGGIELVKAVAEAVDDCPPSVLRAAADFRAQVLEHIDV